MRSVAGDVATWAAVLTIGSIGLGGAGWLGRRVWKVVRRLTLFLDDYEGTPARPGVDARPGVMQRLQDQDQLLAQLAADLALVKDELPKNGVPLAHKIDALWNAHLAAPPVAHTSVVVAPVVAPAPPQADPPPAGE